MADVQLVDTLNKRWKEDKTGFGFRMLQKMGWKEDKGLGKNETGIVSSVKIKKREEKIGLGMEHDAVGNKGWSETANSFNAVLQVLQETYKTSETKKKVKKSSLKISVGMKYKRVKEAKDLSTKSAADMAAILGVSSSSNNIWQQLNNSSESFGNSNNSDSGSTDTEKVVKQKKKDKKTKKKRELTVNS